MILAAGLGTRLRPLTDFVPKPLFPVLNIPLIERSLLALHGQGFTRLFINTFHLSHLIQEWYAEFHRRTGIKAVIEEENELLGTGGGIGNVFRRHCSNDAPLLVINGDVVTDIDLAGLYTLHWDHSRSTPELAASLVVHIRSPWNKLKVEEGQVVSFRSDDVDALAFTGISVLSPQLMEMIPEGPGSIVTVMEHAIEKGMRVQAVMAERVSSTGDGRWIWEDTGTPSGYLRAHEVLLEADSERDCLLSMPDTVVGEEVRCMGWAVAGSRAKIGRDCVLERSVIWADTELSSGSSYRNTIVTPYGTLKDDTDIL